MTLTHQGIEPEGFPLLLQSLKTDSPVKDMHSNPNKKLYGGTAHFIIWLPATFRAGLVMNVSAVHC